LPPLNGLVGGGRVHSFLVGALNFLILIALTITLGTPLAPNIRCTSPPSTRGDKGRKERAHPRGIPHPGGRDILKVASGARRWSRDNKCRDQHNPP